MPPPVKLFLAARKGPRVLQKPTAGSWDPATTLRQLAASVLGPEVVLTRVEACTKPSEESTIWEGDSLDETIQFYVTDCGLRFVKCVFEDDEPVN